MEYCAFCPSAWLGKHAGFNPALFSICCPPTPRTQPVGTQGPLGHLCTRSPSDAHTQVARPQYRPCHGLPSHHRSLESITGNSETLSTCDSGPGVPTVFSLHVKCSHTNSCSHSTHRRSHPATLQEVSPCAHTGTSSTHATCPRVP